MHMRKTLALVLLILFFLLSGCGDSPVSPKKILNVSTIENSDNGGTKTVSISFGNDDSHYIAVSVNSKYIKEGTELRSSNISLSHDLFPFSAWGKFHYLVTSQHPTFVDLKIISIDMEKKKAIVQIAGKLFNSNTKKYIEFEKKSFEITGEFFDKFTHFLVAKEEKVTMTLK
ncbi:MAG: hypothetical protein GY710_25665 [Desulfobacteraceae bacterium]|nr:hypothetical protein [Desulfobacteraceae bacterium]